MNGEKIKELLKYKKIIEYPLFTRVTIDGKNDFLANHYIYLYNYHDNWSSNKHFKDFTFTHDSTEIFTHTENEILKRVHNKINNTNLESSISKNGIIRVVMKSLSPDFSKEFLTALVESLGDFFVETSVEQDHRNLEFIIARRDSIFRELSKAEGGLGAAQDRTTGLVYSSGYINQERQKRKVTLLSEMYLQSIRNHESAKLSLLKNTPIVQVIDYPIRSMFPSRANAMNSAIIGFIVSFVLLFFVAIMFFLAQTEIRKLKSQIQN